MTCYARSSGDETLTVREFERLPEDECRSELVRGRVVREPPTVRAPDAAFVAAARLPPDGLPTGYLPFAPDLAVEVASPSNSASQLRAKVLDFLDAGTHLVWVVDPRTRTVAVYRSREAIRMLDTDAELDGGDVLPGFVLPVGALFVD